MVIADRFGSLRSVTLADAEVSTSFQIPDATMTQSTEARRVLPGADGTLHACYDQRMVWYETDGTILGADAVADDDRNYRWLARSDSSVLLIDARAEQSPVRNPAGRHTEYHYSIYSLAADGRLLAPPVRLSPFVQPATRVALIDGWVFLSTASDCVCVRMPAD